LTFGYFNLHRRQFPLIKDVFYVHVDIGNRGLEQLGQLLLAQPGRKQLIRLGFLNSGKVHIPKQSLPLEVTSEQSIRYLPEKVFG
jgi:hypothetical protein